MVDDKNNSGGVGRGEILKDPVHLTFLGNGGVCFNELTVKCDIVEFIL